MSERTALVLINRNSKRGEADLGPALDLLRDGGLELVDLTDPQALGRAGAIRSKADPVSLAPRGFWQLILTSPLLRWGHHRDERVRHWRGTEIEIDTHRPMPVNTDGEVTTTTPARIQVVPKTITVFTP